MCEPVSMGTLFAATLAMSTASAAAGLVGQQQAYNTNAANAANTMRIQNSQTNLGIQQTEAANSQKAQDQQIEMLKAAATAQASAGESGTAGNSVDALIGDYHAAEGRYMNSLSVQNQMNRQQAGMEKQAQQASAQNQVNAVAKPDFLGAALRIGGDALSGYNKTIGRNATK